MLLGLLKLAAGAAAVHQTAKTFGLLEDSDTVKTCPRVPQKTHKSAAGATYHTMNVDNIDERICPAIEHIRKSKRDPDFQQMVGKMLNKKCGKDWCVPERDSSAEMNHIYEETRKRIRFTKDPRGFDVFKSPKRTFKDGFGDCGNGNIALAAAYEAAGYKTRVRVVAVHPDGPKEFSHVLTLVQNPDDQRWLKADISVRGKLGDYPADRVSGHRDYEVPI